MSDKMTAVNLIGTVLTVVKGALHGLMSFASTVFSDFLEIRIVRFETIEANMSRVVVQDPKNTSSYISHTWTVSFIESCMEPFLEHFTAFNGSWVL